MSSNDNHVYFLKQDKHSKKFFISVPNDERGGCQCEPTCATSIAVIDPVASYSPSSLLLAGVTAAGSTALYYGTGLAALITDAINDVPPACALANIEKCHTGDKCCQPFEINIAKEFGTRGTSGYVVGCTTYPATLAVPVVTIGASAIAGLSGATTLNNVLGLTGSFLAMPLYVTPALIGGPPLPAIVPTIRVGTQLLTPLGGTGGLINSAFPCAIGNSAMLSDNAEVCVDIRGFNTIFLTTSGGTIAATVPFDTSLSRCKINSFPPGLGVTGAVLSLTNPAIEFFLNANGPYQTTGSGVPIPANIVTSLAPYVNSTALALLGTQQTMLYGIYFGGMVINTIDTRYDITVDVTKRPLYFRSAISSTLPNCTAGFILYTSLGPCDYECLGPKLAFTNTATSQVSVFGESQLKVIPYERGFPAGAQSGVMLKPRYTLPAGTYSVCLILGCQIYDAGTVTLTGTTLLTPVLD